MRICVLNLDFAPIRTSGLAIYGERLVEGYLSRGHQVTVVTAAHSGLPRRQLSGPLRIFRVPTFHLDWIGLGATAPRCIAQLLDARTIDVAHVLDVHFGYGLPRGFVASAFQSFRQRATAYRGLPYATSPLDRLARRAYYEIARRQLETPALRRAAHIIMASHATANEFIANYAVASDQVSVIPLGIDTQLFSRRGSTTLRERLRLSNKIVLLHVGFVGPRKGLETLAHALRRLPEDIILIQVGRWNRVFRDRFRHEFPDMRDRIIELGFMSDASLPEIYSSADAAVFPSYLEGFGLPVAEAMACETPVIVAGSGSLPEVVGNAGIVVESGDDAALADAIRACTMDKVRAQELGRLGRQRVVDSFTIDRMVDSTLAVLRQTLGGILPRVAVRSSV